MGKRHLLRSALSNPGFCDGATGAALLVHVSSGEGPSRLEGIRDGVLEVCLQAREKERMNHLLVDLFSRLLQVTPQQIEVVAGTQTQTNKVLVFYDLTPSELEARLKPHL